MAEINVLDCTTRRGNTGLGKCQYKLKPRRFAIFTPKGEIITAANLANWAAYLISKLIHNDPLQRWYCIGPLKGFDPNGEALKAYSYQDGSKVTTADATESMLYQLANSLCVAKNLQDFDNSESSFDVFYIDTDDMAQLYQTTTTGNAVAVKGFIPDEISTPAPDQPNYGTPGIPKIQITHNNPKDNIRNMAIIDMKSSPMQQLSERYAVQTVTATEVTPGGAAAGVFHIAFMGGCGSDNLAKEFPTQLPVGARFTAKNAATLGVITITGVALNAAGTAVVFTLNAADADYPTVGLGILIDQVSVSDWATGGMAYFELPDPITVLAT